MAVAVIGLCFFGIVCLPYSYPFRDSVFTVTSSEDGMDYG